MRDADGIRLQWLNDHPFLVYYQAGGWVGALLVGQHYHHRSFETLREAIDYARGE